MGLMPYRWIVDFRFRIADERQHSVINDLGSVHTMSSDYGCRSFCLTPTSSSRRASRYAGWHFRPVTPRDGSSVCGAARWPIIAETVLTTLTMAVVRMFRIDRATVTQVQIAMARRSTWHDITNPTSLTTPTKIIMCTGQCATLQADTKGGKIDIAFGCVTQGGPGSSSSSSSSTGGPK